MPLSYGMMQTDQDAEQPFENGHMFCRQDYRYIDVVYESGPRAGTYEVFTDERQAHSLWESGQ